MATLPKIIERKEYFLRLRIRTSVIFSSNTLLCIRFSKQQQHQAATISEIAMLLQFDLVFDI
jgi:hypothetical protein